MAVFQLCVSAQSLPYRLTLGFYWYKLQNIFIFYVLDLKIFQNNSTTLAGFLKQETDNLFFHPHPPLAQGCDLSCFGKAKANY
jgi:hypothetical protein